MEDAVVEKARSQQKPKAKEGPRVGQPRAGADEGLSLLRLAIANGQPAPDTRFVKAEARENGKRASGAGGTPVQPIQAQLSSFRDVGSVDRAIPRMKRPEELRELLRICRTALKGSDGFLSEEVHAEEINIQVPCWRQRPGAGLET